MNVRGKWSVVIALASAQFIMVLDSTVMNVSIEKVIDDLHTSVTTMQLAISAYTLTMASLMMLGGKIGDIIGRRRAFRIGLALFGLGAGITAIAPSMAVLIIGWSLIEAMGAALMIPAVMSLITGNYQGRDRALSFGIVTGVVGAAAACGPIIGGYVSTTWSWRDVFAGEVAVVAVLLLASRLIKDSPLEGRRPKLDAVGALLSVGGLACAVLGIVQSTDWGWIAPKDSPVEPFGLSVVPFLIMGGIALLACFAEWEMRVERRGGDPLVRLGMLGIPRLRSGLLTMLTTMLAMGGAFFVLPLYLQIVEGLDPLDTGVHMLPLSVAVFLTSIAASRLSGRFGPRRLIRTGQATIFTGAILLLATMDAKLETAEFLGSMAVAGVGIGMIMSQIGNVNLSSVSSDETSEAGGLQGTAQNLGSALGTALIGSILLTSLTVGFDNHVESNPAIPEAARQQIVSKASGGLQFVPASEAERVLQENKVPQATITPVVDDYSESQIRALKTGLGGVALIVLLGFFATFGLPREPLAPSGP
jgi:EmrB/QacA subfamily drug resistance transporter